MQDPSLESTPAPRQRRGATWIRTAATTVGFAVPVAGYLSFIHAYAVNTIAGDQWGDVTVATRSFQHATSFRSLWGQWAVERMFFPRLVVIVLAHLTRLNVVVEMYLSAGLLIAAAALLVVAHRRRAASVPWWAYCPVAFVLLSVVAYEDTLWGFQLAWYMVLLALALVVFLLDGPVLGWPGVAVAAAVAVVGSYSSFQGLLVWPVGLLLLYYRRRGLRRLVVWSALAVGAIGVYFAGFDWTQLGKGGPGGFHHPVTAVRMFFSVVGDVFGTSVSIFSRGDNPTLVAGVLIVACAVWVVLRHGLRPDPAGAGPLGVGLICFGLLWALALAASQPSEITIAFLSRFRLYTLLVLVGMYLVVLSPRSSSEAPSPAGDGRRPASPGWPGLARRDALRTATGALVLALVVAQVVLGTHNGIAGGRKTHDARVLDAEFIANAHLLSVPVVQAVEPIFAVPLLTQTPQARRWRLSLFDTELPAAYERAGINGGQWLGSTAPHITPWRGVRPGTVVEAQGGGFPPGRALALVQCNGKFLTEKLPALDCLLDRSVSVPAARSGRIDTPFTVVGGAIGDGSCNRGQTCFVAVFGRDPRNPLAYGQLAIG